ncbi:hypothetical protein ABIE26_002964 [Pedobacter africanus]|uniref:hypothetical protein n=1 Tax=Pedobacter africanus TaxID=151894 RepID=UPI003392014C
MKHKFLGLAILILFSIAAASHSFHMESPRNFWSLTNSKTPYDPSAYTQFTGPPHNCPGEGKVCFIEIQASDLIPIGQYNAGKPNVIDNPQSKTDLHDDIVTAISIAINDPFFGSNGRIIHERD